MYDLFLLDADGTLFDFQAMERAALGQLFAQLHLPADEQMMAGYRRINEALWRRLAEGTIRKEQLLPLRFEQFAQAYGLALDASQTNEQYLDLLSRQGQVMPGAEQTLQGLSRRGPVVIVTNGVARVQRGKLARSGLAPYISHLIISEEVGAEKPAPGIFEAALAAANHPHKQGVLMAGDSVQADILGARRFGIDSCLFDPQNACFTSGATHRITRLTQLLDIV